MVITLLLLLHKKVQTEVIQVYTAHHHSLLFGQQEVEVEGHGELDKDCLEVLVVVAQVAQIHLAD